MNVPGQVSAGGHFAGIRESADPVPCAVTLDVHENELDLVFVFSLDRIQATRLAVEGRSRGARKRQGDGLFAAEAGEP